MQVVGVADSGLDLDSCYLFDSGFEEYQTNASSTESITATGSDVAYAYFDGDAAGHRKVGGIMCKALAFAAAPAAAVVVVEAAAAAMADGAAEALTRV